MAKITRVCFADDDADDHFVFSLAMKELFPIIEISPFFDCGNLIKNLNDMEINLPDLIVLDYNMPGNSGSECLQTIKKTARLLHIPVVIHSTSRYQQTINESQGFGAFKYIVKKNNFEEVKEMIRQLIVELEN